MTVTPGVYYILTNKATGTVADWNQTDQKSLIGFNRHGYPNQQWIFEDAGSGLYYIKSGKGPYITFTGHPAAHTPVLVTSSKQAWRVIPDSVDSSAIKIVYPPQPNLVLDLTASNRANNTPIILFPIHTGRNQAWSLTPLGPPPPPPPPPAPSFNPLYAVAFYLVNQATKTVAEVNTADHKNVVGKKRARAVNQIWFFETVDKAKNLYHIRSGNGTYLSIDGQPATRKQVNVNHTKTTWFIKPVANNSPIIRIYYPGTDYLVDLTASNPADGTAIIVYPTQNPGINQQFRIEPAV